MCHPGTARSKASRGGRLHPLVARTPEPSRRAYPRARSKSRSPRGAPMPPHSLPNWLMISLDKAVFSSLLPERTEMRQTPAASLTSRRISTDWASLCGVQPLVESQPETTKLLGLGSTPLSRASFMPSLKTFATVGSGRGTMESLKTCCASLPSKTFQRRKKSAASTARGWQNLEAGSGSRSTSCTGTPLDMYRTAICGASP
mmetsp:Transcript_19406/g.39548  ORF Transcript_19406/g.39548 Transcript_19406/m.39548 type:complete len:202 (-) Transcript_19406:148-753(-)